MAIANQIDSRQNLKPTDTPAFNNVAIGAIPANPGGRVVIWNFDKTLGFNSSITFYPIPRSFAVGQTNFSGGATDAIAIGGASNEANGTSSGTYSCTGSTASAEQSVNIGCFGGDNTSAYGIMAGCIFGNSGTGNAHINMGNNQGGTGGNNEFVTQIGSDESITYGQNSATIGGSGNQLGSFGNQNANYSFIAAGYLQKVFGSYGSAVYGFDCEISSGINYSAVGGRKAKAAHDDCFVLGLDGNPIVSTAAGQFIVKPSASGGVGFGAAPAASAILGLTSTTKGFLAPVMTTAQRLAIVSPANGLEVIDSTLGAVFYYLNSAWKTFDLSTEGTLSIIWGGAVPALANSALAYKISGTFVTLSFSNLGAVAISSSLITSTTLLPVSLRPFSSKTTVLTGIDNSSSVFCVATVLPTGQIQIGVGSSSSSFTGSGSTGFSAFSLSYNI
jgi:hypothetical protein